MDQREKKMTSREKIKIVVVTGMFAAIGAIMGVAAYWQGWLG